MLYCGHIYIVDTISMNIRYTNMVISLDKPLFNGHLSIAATNFGTNGVHDIEVPLYSFYGKPKYHLT